MKSSDPRSTTGGGTRNSSHRHSEKQDSKARARGTEKSKGGEGGRKRNTGAAAPTPPTDGSEPSTALRTVGIGLASILAAPFFLAGAAVVTGGAVVYGCGKLLEGVGKTLVAGPKAAFDAATQDSGNEGEDEDGDGSEE